MHNMRKKPRGMTRKYAEVGTRREDGKLAKGWKRDLTDARIFDTHAHYDDEAFDADREEVLLSLAGLGVGAIVDVASTVDSQKKVQAVVKEIPPKLRKEHPEAKLPEIYAAYGLHPEVAEKEEADQAALDEVQRLLRTKEAVALGEIGLDYYWSKEHKDRQKEIFAAQLEMARSEKKPVIIHSRKAAQDTIEMSKDLRLSEIGGVLHCYSYSIELAREYLNMGMFLGIGGAITFKNAPKLRHLVGWIPLSSIVLETDCPYMTPEPYRGKRNFSGYLIQVAEKIAEIKELSAQRVLEETWTNARRLYRLG